MGIHSDRQTYMPIAPLLGCVCPVCPERPPDEAWTQTVPLGGSPVMANGGADDKGWPGGRCRPIRDIYAAPITATELLPFGRPASLLDARPMSAAGQLFAREPGPVPTGDGVQAPWAALRGRPTLPDAHVPGLGLANRLSGAEAQRRKSPAATNGPCWGRKRIRRLQCP